MKRSAKALLLVDVFNPLDFPNAGKLAPDAVRAARNAASLAVRCRQSRTGPSTEPLQHGIAQAARAASR